MKVYAFGPEDAPALLLLPLEEQFCRRAALSDPGFPGAVRQLRRL